MKTPPSPITPRPSAARLESLSETDYQRLKQELAEDLKAEIRRAGNQHVFSIGLQALTLIFMAVVLFLSSERYHDFMLWAVGICLLLFSVLQFLDLDFAQTNHSWLGLLQRQPPKKNDSEI